VLQWPQLTGFDQITRVQIQYTLRCAGAARPRALHLRGQVTIARLCRPDDMGEDPDGLVAAMANIEEQTLPDLNRFYINLCACGNLFRRAIPQHENFKLVRDRAIISQLFGSSNQRELVRGGCFVPRAGRAAS
jgi:hypothetical protein